MLTYGRTITEKAIAERLAELFPQAVDVDFAVIAAELVDCTNLEAMDRINAREAGLHAAVLAVMDYYNGIVSDLRSRVADLERKAKGRTLANARHEPLKAVGS